METAVVLAGGHGLRLWPLTERTPKPMIPIDHRPIMEFVVSALRASGLGRILVILQYNPGPIVDHFGNGGRFGIRIDYVLQEGELGTAGSVRQALDVLEDEEFVVTSSDILFTGDLLGGVEFHRANKADATIALSEVEDPTEFGIVAADRGGRICQFHEKPPRGSTAASTVNAGIYLLNRRILAKVPMDRPTDFGHELFPTLVDKGRRIFGWKLPGYWRDIGTFQSLSAARQDIRELPYFKNLVTRWPASRSGEGGRIWIRKRRKAPAREWLDMDFASIGQAAGLIWKHLAERSGHASTIAELQKLKGIAANDALAAVGWLAREGKLEFQQKGRTTRVSLSPAELQGLSR